MFMDDYVPIADAKFCGIQECENGMSSNLRVPGLAVPKSVACSRLRASRPRYGVQACESENRVKHTKLQTLYAVQAVRR